MQKEITKIKQRYVRRACVQGSSTLSDSNLMYQRDFELSLHHMLKYITALSGPINTLKLLDWLW